MWESTEPAAVAARKTFGKTAEQIVNSDADAMKKAATEAETAFKALEKVALGFEGKVAGFGGNELTELEGRLSRAATSPRTSRSSETKRRT
jgi:hypothetical protein